MNGVRSAPFSYVYTLWIFGWRSVTGEEKPKVQYYIEILKIRLVAMSFSENRLYFEPWIIHIAQILDSFSVPHVSIQFKKKTYEFSRHC